MLLANNLSFSRNNVNVFKDINLSNRQTNIISMGHRNVMGLTYFEKTNEIIVDDLKNYESLGVYHHIGGTRIGSDSKNSVVDNNLKIHGNKNLYIAGSSVFPTSGYTNPTFTIVQLSLRLGEHIFNKIS